MAVKEDNNMLTVSVGLLRGSALALAVGISTLTTVYWNFEAQSRELEFIKEKIDYERDRTDRKINPVEDRLIDLETKLMLEKIELLEAEKKLLKIELEK